MSMSISYEETGRRQQKARTRKALVDAARALVQEGVSPTVEEAAEAASVSRATAYRYFPNREALLVAAHPEVETPSLLGSDPPDDVEARLDLVVEGLAAIFLAAEESYRTMLRLSLETDSPGRELALRKGRRFLWIEDALEPLRGRLSDDRFQRLVHAISINIGIEALVALIDLAGLSRERAVDVMRWSANALLRASLEDPAERQFEAS
jgi:AcrR family transcriptional regulator